MAVRKVLAIALVIAACGGSTAAPSERTPEGTTPSAAAENPATTTAATALPRQRSDGPDAPAFTLALGQGGEFSPAAETKPIYMVFWAEW